MAVRKISVSLDAEELEWLKKEAAARRKTVSGVVAEATRLLRQFRARKKVLEYLGDSARLTPKRIKEIEREWKG